MEDFLILYHVFAFVTPVSLSSFGDVFSLTSSALPELTFVSARENTEINSFW